MFDISYSYLIQDILNGSEITEHLYVNNLMAFSSLDYRAPLSALLYPSKNNPNPCLFEALT